MHFRSNITKVQNWAEGYINRTYHLCNGESYLITWGEAMKSRAPFFMQFFNMIYDKRF